MTNYTPIHSILSALIALIVLVRPTIADMAQPDATVPPPIADSIPMRFVDSPITEPAQPVMPAPTASTLSAIDYRLSTMVYLPLVQRGEKYPPANRAYELEVLRLVNEQRASAGLWPLVEDATLTQAARRHAQDMAVNHLLGHSGSDGSTAKQRMTDEGFIGTPWTEAVVLARLTPTETVNTWMDSPGHRAIVLDRTATRIGMGCSFIAVDPYAGSYAWVIDLGLGQ